MNYYNQLLYEVNQLIKQLVNREFNNKNKLT
jgi:hypothetical protein